MVPFWMYVSNKSQSKLNGKKSSSLDYFINFFFCHLQKCVTALDKTWHTEHFFCAQCGQQFGEDGFHERDGKPYCRNDYFDMFAPKCAGCNRAIMENYISALNSQWHAECFVCRVSHFFSKFFWQIFIKYSNLHHRKKNRLNNLAAVWNGFACGCLNKMKMCANIEYC